MGIAISGGDLYVADYKNDRVEEFNEKSEYVSTFGSKGMERDSSKVPCHWLSVRAGDVWVGDQGNNRLEEFSSSGTFIETLGFGVGNGEAKFEVCTSSCKAGIAGSGNGQFSNLEGIAFSGGNMYVADDGNDRVEQFNEKANM